MVLPFLKKKKKKKKKEYIYIESIEGCETLVPRYLGDHGTSETQAIITRTTEGTMLSYDEYKELAQTPGVRDLDELHSLSEEEKVFVLAAASSLDPAVAYITAFDKRARGTSAALAAAALLNRADINKAYKKCVSVLAMNEAEALVYMAKIARDHNASPRDRVQALTKILAAEGVFDRKNGTTWKTTVSSGRPEDAIQEIAFEIKEG